MRIISDLLRLVLAHIDAQADRFVAELMAYASQPSISAQGVGIDEAARLLERKFLALGLDTEIVPSAGNPRPSSASSAAPCCSSRWCRAWC